MITVSSNFVANLLIEKLGVENICKRPSTRFWVLEGSKALRGVEDEKAFEKAMEHNSTTARGLLVLLERIGRRSGGESIGPTTR